MIHEVCRPKTWEKEEEMQKQLENQVILVKVING